MDMVDFGRYAGGLLVTLGLLAALGWAARRFDLFANLRGERAGRRLAIVETLPIDARRRLALVRADGREHLILLGAAGDVLLHSGPAGQTDAPPAPAVEGAKP